MTTEPFVEREVEYWDISRLIPYEKNAKQHSKEQVKKIAASIKTFGWIKAKAIEVTPEGEIINGHGRRLAALELGMKRVPVVVRDDLTPEQIRAYRLADNQVAESDYDTGLLADELRDLHVELSFDMSDFFDERDLQFAIEDLGTMDLQALSSDIQSEVDAKQAQTQERINKEQGAKFEIDKVLGFKHVNADQRRTLNRLMVMAEDETGLKGSEALCAFVIQHCF